MSKLGLVIQGGGSRGTYTAGPLEVLCENEIWADVVIGTSCGGLMGCNYVSKEAKRAREITLLSATDKKWFSPFNLFNKGTMFDYDYLVNVVGKTMLPFNFDQFSKNPCKFYVVASNCLTGETGYLEKSEPGFLPKAIAASAALPLTSRPVFFRGVPWLDGGITCPIGFQKALLEGCDKVLVLATRQKGYRKKKIRADQLRLVEHMYKTYPVWLEVYRKNIEIYNAQMDEMDALEQAGKIFVIYPSEPLKISHSERSVKKLIRLMDLGKKDALNSLSSLKSYLSK
jgi:predicted patatin/cPLA2 family phospholipase